MADKILKRKINFFFILRITKNITTCFGVSSIEFKFRKGKV